MPQHDLICDICFKEYDLEDHLPRVIPECGHTLCSLCILHLLATSEWFQFQCPFDKKIVTSITMDEETFPKNFKLMTLIETKRNLKELTKERSPTENSEPSKEPVRSNMEKLDMSSDSSVSLEAKFKEELNSKDVEILNKRIVKLKNSLEERKNLNKKMLLSLRKKKYEMTSLADEVNLVYVKVDKMSMEFEEGLMETNRLKDEIEVGEKRLQVMRTMLAEAYKETKNMREEMQRREDSVKEFVDKLRELQEKKKDLEDQVEDAKEENKKLMSCLELKEAEKNAIKEELTGEMKKQEKAKDRMKREKNEVCWNVETLKILVGQGKAECAKLNEQVEAKKKESMLLKEQIEEIVKEREEAKRLCRKLQGDRGKQCNIF